VADAVVAGLAGMLGAGLFVGLAPASSFGGHWLLVGIVIATVTAACSCATTGDQSGVFPGAGGGYRYTREQLGRLPGRFAAGLYLVGRSAAVAALAGCFGVYASPGRPLLGALGVLVFAVAVNATGLTVPRVVVRVLVGFVIVVLGLVVAACYAIPPPTPTGVPVPSGLPGNDDPAGLLPAAGVMFFAFIGFERITAPGDRSRIARLRVVIPVLLVVSAGIYLAVGAAVLRQLGPVRLALSSVPLRDALVAADAASLDPLLTAAVAVATAGALIVGLRGARDTVRTMAVNGDVPSSLTTALVAGGAVLGLLTANPVQTLELAATCGLLYFAFANASARLLSPAERSWPSRVSCLGMGLCVLIAMMMPGVDLMIAVGAMVLGLVVGPLFARVRSVRQ
jgi:APA family basic amino acid/polyamine antiporter